MSPALSLFLTAAPFFVGLLLLDTLVKSMWVPGVFRLGLPVKHLVISNQKKSEIEVGDLTLIFNLPDRSSKMRFRTSAKGFLFRSIFFSQGNSDTGFTLQAIALFDGILERKQNAWVIRPIINGGRLGFFILIGLFLGWLLTDLSGPAGRGDALVAVLALTVVFVGYLAFSAVVEWGRLVESATLLGDILEGRRAVPRPGAEDYK